MIEPANDYVHWNQSTRSNLSVINFLLPGSADAVGRFQQLLAWDLSEWAHLFFIFGILGFIKTYALQLSTLIDQYYSKQVQSFCNLFFL